MQAAAAAAAAEQSRAGVTKNANICSQSCQPSAEYTVAPRRTQMKLAQMTLYANIFKISLLLGHFLLPPPPHHIVVVTVKLVQTNPSLLPLSLLLSHGLRSWRRLL